jgi:protoporphyrinogen oxidase
LNKQKVIIVGAGPAGLTAGYELIKKGFDVTIFEADSLIGGISKTVDHNGNKIDLGGHRFFSKIPEVNNWWSEILTDDFMTRDRKSRIFYERKFYDYPISLNFTTLKNIGFIRILKIGFTYTWSLVFKKKEKSLEDFFINRFGSELYKTFFKDYTQKVWGVPCNRINPLFGYQRVKGLSILAVLKHAVKKLLNLENKKTETSLIESFKYPKFGPGQLWDRVGALIEASGGKIIKDSQVTNITQKDNKYEVKSNEEIFEADILISSMPLIDLYKAFDFTIAQQNLKDIAYNLIYRDFITVGLLVDKFKIEDVSDNWIYIQENDVKLGRVQFFNNWSPYLVKDKDFKWVGLEYFCQEGDDMWSMEKDDFINFAINEFSKLGFVSKDDVKDSVVIHVKKAYPSYFGSYDQIETLIAHLKTLNNIYCIGRNGQHRYNNMDHSMMTAFTAVDIILGNKTQEDLWDINTEKEYHESK